MAVPRRVWDSCIVIGYLAGYEELKPDCLQIIEQAKRGELEIMVSALATIEVAYLQGSSDADSEAKIQEFFSRDYVIPVAIDISIAATARYLIRKYSNNYDYKLRPPDAAHLALAIQWKVPILETTDTDLLRLNELEGTPPVVIRKPLYEGQPRLMGD
ncbi:MAG: type II toxin-antitoxin system VapC family toxin [Chloroflexi bacterium]|nr:type II toxin-antitoxin system VapC family toxin [Chloroflexota bacterium]